MSSADQSEQPSPAQSASSPPPVPVALHWEPTAAWRTNGSFSPTIPMLQSLWDSTSLGALKECPRKYYYSIVLGFVPRATSVHLTFGQHYHSALEQYDHAKAAGATHDDAVLEALRHTLIVTWNTKLQRPWDSDDRYKNRETLVRTVLWYLDVFRNDPFKTVQLANGKPAVELSFRFNTSYSDPNGNPYLLCGHMDRVAEWNNQLWIMDRKTTKSTISQDFFGKFSPDNQFTLYTLAGKVAFDLPVKGIIVDGAQVAVSFSRFARCPVERHISIIEEWYSELGSWLQSAEQYALAQHWPINDKSCIAGDSIITVSRGKFFGKKVTIAKLYDWFQGKTGANFNPNLATYTLSDKGGYVSKQKIIDVLQQGVKPVFQLETLYEQVRATADHQFNTPDGWKRLDELKAGDSIFIWKKRDPTGKKAEVKRKIIYGITFHPNAQLHWVRDYPHHRLAKSRLVVEASLNNLSYNDYIQILKEDRNMAKTLIYLTSSQEVHHMDSDVTNDNLDNLQLVSVQEHAKLHEQERVMAMNRLSVSVIKRIVAVGETMTYDLVVEAPHHNFIANGFVAHNCGNYGGCPYRSVCSKAPSVRSQWLKSDFVRRTWDPSVARGDI